MKIFYKGPAAVSYRGHVIIPGENDLPDEIAVRVKDWPNVKDKARSRRKGASSSRPTGSGRKPNG